MKSSRVGQVWRHEDFVWLVVGTHYEGDRSVMYIMLYLTTAQDDWPQVPDNFVINMTEWGEGTWDVDWMMERIV